MGADELGDFFTYLGKAAKTVGKKIQNNSGKASEIVASIGSSDAGKNPEIIVATACKVINLVQPARGLYSGEVSSIFNITSF